MRSPVILRVFKDKKLVEVKQFEKDQIVIGQSADVQLDLPGDGVSPIHCVIEKRDEQYYICDLGSASGTFKNGQAILDESLSSGDEIIIGPYKISFFVGVPKVKAPVETAPEQKMSSMTEMVAPQKPTQVPPSIPQQVALPTEKPKPVDEPVVVKPRIKELRPKQNIKQKAGQTFAPVSSYQDLREILKPQRGQTVEVIVAWRERILNTYHFKAKGNYSLGQTSSEHVVAPSSSIPRKWPLLEISSAVKVNLSESMNAEVITSGGVARSIEDCLASGKAQRSGTALSVRLDQNEMIYFEINEISIIIRFAPLPPAVAFISPLGLSGSEMSALVMSLVVTSLIAFYISAMTPKDLYESQEEITRTAQIIFNKPPEAPKPPPPPVQPPPPQETKTPPPPVKPPEPKKAELADQKKEAQKKGAQNNQQGQRAETAGRASEVAPIPNSQNRPKKFTSTKQGGAKKIGQQAGANANMGKDVSKIGLFSAFSGGGIRSKLDQAARGAGDILGDADKSTGSTGYGQDREGEDLGSKFKDTGAGGKGTATQGIAGIGTRGRGSGQSAYGSLDGFGAKSSVAIEPGGAEEEFVGSIDKEAVRRRVRHYLSEIRGCYVRELNKLEKGQKLEGKVIMTWEIVENGLAKNVRVKSSTLGNAKVENCIRERLASWSFPDPPKGLTAEISYPFFLRQE